MRSKRPAILMGILLALVIGYVGHQMWPRYRYAADQAPLAGKNSVSNLAVHREPNGSWIAEFDYFYTGAPMVAALDIELSHRDDEQGGAATPIEAVWIAHAERGAHHARAEVKRPGGIETTTSRVVVARLQGSGQTLAKQEVAQVIDWPDYTTYALERELADKGPDASLKRAVALIDEGQQSTLREAKVVLERVINKDPRYVPAYIELARVAMKTNWGPEGLHQAETLLGSALQIQPDSVNAKVLLGYVYAHQTRFKPAETLFAEAANAGATNLWLWSNWGEALAMQGKIEPAIEKYREGLSRPRSDATNDRARIDAYAHLLELLERRKDFSGMEALHKRRADEFGAFGCFGADYSQFVLQQRGDATAAIAIARAALDAHCSEAKIRTALGLAYYVASANANGSQRAESLNQARVFLPTGPGVLYLLAGSDQTVGAARQLIASGESIDQRDNDRFNALSYALQNRNYPSARRLLQMGARPDALVSDGDVPVALMPVMSRDIEGIRVMRQAGVDYSKLRYQGSTAIDEAKRTGDRRLLEALDPKAQSL